MFAQAVSVNRWNVRLTSSHLQWIIQHLLTWSHQTEVWCDWLIATSFYKKLFVYLFTRIATAASHFPFSLHVWSALIHPLPEHQMCSLHVVCRAIVICHCWLISYCGRHGAIESHPELWAMSWWGSLSDEHKMSLDICWHVKEVCSSTTFFSHIIW